MSPNWLSAIGRATPAITQSMHDIQERPKEEARWGWEQEQAVQQREISGQRKALGEMQINALKYQDEQRKKKEEFRKTPYNYKSDIAFAGLPDEFVEKTIGRAKGMGLKMDTMGDREDYFAKLKESPPMIKEYSEAKDFELQRVAQDAFDNLEKLLKTPGIPEDKIKKAQEAVEMANAKRAQGKDAGDKYLKAIGFKLLHEKLMNSPEFKALPWEKQQVIDKAAISVLQGANPKEYADAVKETLFPTKEKVTELYSTREEAVRSSPPVKGYTTSAELTDKGWKPHYLPEEKDLATSGLREFEIATGINPSKRGTPEYSDAYMKFLGGKKQATADPIQQKKLGADLRKEFNNLQPVKDYRDIETRFNVMGKTIEEAKTTKNFIAVDQALITIFNKMTDPQSVVRESEYLRTPQDLAIWNRIKGKVSKLGAGGAGLTSEDRNALYTMGKQFQRAYESKFNQLRNEYRGYAVDYGLDPETVIKQPKTVSGKDYKSMSNEELLKALEK